MLPILRGVRWDEAMPVMVALDAAEPVEKAPRAKRVRKAVAEPVKAKKSTMRFGPPGFDEIEEKETPVPQAIARIVRETLPAPVRETVRKRAKVDPKLIAVARELRDRYLEQVNDPMNAASMPWIVGKYDVSRLIAAKSRTKLVAA